MSKRMLADVLWDAANEQLWTGEPDQRGEEYSCLAVKEVAHRHTGFWGSNNETAEMQFLDSLGCDFNRSGDELQAMYDTKAERQGVRYMWLLLAMHVAEDEGITV